MGCGPEQIVESGLKGLFSRLGVSSLIATRSRLTIRFRWRLIPRFSLPEESPRVCASAVTRKSSPSCRQEIAMRRLER